MPFGVAISSSLRSPIETIKATGLRSEQSRNVCLLKASVLRPLNCLIPMFLTSSIVPRYRCFGKILVLLAKQLRMDFFKGGGLAKGYPL